MPRLPGLRALRALLLPAALALLPLPLGACSSHGGAADAGAVEPVGPIPAPAGHLGDFFLPAPAATWAKARTMMGAAAPFLPQSFSALVSNMVGLPITLSGELDDGVPVVGAALRADPTSPVQMAVALHVKAGDRFVTQVTQGEGARFNASVDLASHVTLLTDKVAPESARFALGVLGNYLLIAARPGDLYALGPYVVRTLGAASAVPRDDLAFELPEKALAGPVLDQVRKLRAQTEGAAATLVPLSGLLDTASTLLGDASRARLTVNLDTSIHVRVTVTPKPGGAASKLVADLAVGDVKPLLDLPEGTTLGLLWRESAAARAENAPKQADALARLLGPDVTEGDRAAISSALRAEAEARGDYQAVGVAFNGTGPSAVVRAPATDPDRMKKALKQLVDLAGLGSFKKALATLGIRISVDKAVVENVAADVTRVRLARSTEDDARDPKNAKVDAKARGDGKPKGDKKAGDHADANTPKAIDLLYFVDASGLFASAGYDSRDSLRALTRAPAGPNLSGNAPLASALGAVSGDAAFVLVADALRISAMTSGTVPPATSSPLLLAAGRTGSSADLWGRLDVPPAVVQLLWQEYNSRRKAAPAAP